MKEKLFDAFWFEYQTADFVAIPVNCQGAIGKGLALAIRPYLANIDYEHYKYLCHTGVKPGEVHASNKFIFCFTKDHWKTGSKLEWIEACLQNLLVFSGVGKKLLLPYLGTGLGGLSLLDVQTLYDYYVPKMSFKEVVVK